MNTAKVYSGISGKTELAEQIGKDEHSLADQSHNMSKKQSSEVKQIDAAQFNAKNMWLQSTTTSELIKELSKKFDLLIMEALNNACAYATTNNHQQVIQKLIRAHETQELIRSIMSVNQAVNKQQ